MNHILDDYFSNIKETGTLVEILTKLSIDLTNCELDNCADHLNCYQYKHQLPHPTCPVSLFYLILNIFTYNPSVVEDNCQALVSEYFRKNLVKPPCILNVANLSLLQNSKTPTLTWIKFESLVIRLIKDRVYEPKCMSNEVLSLVKNKLSMDLRGRLASVVKSCVPHCQKVIDNDEEERNKWCEILDWMSWFLGDKSEDSE